ncbi:MAG: hypothetical protein AB8B72_00750 [Crocinitomicaceae bacterium]
MKVFLLIVPCLVLPSCSILFNKIKNTPETELGTKEIVYTKEIDTDGEFVNIGGGLGLKMNSFTNGPDELSSINYGINLRGTYHNLKVGELSFQAFMPVFQPRRTFSEVIAADQSKVVGDIDLVLKIPVFKFSSVKPRKVSAIDSKDNPYIISGLPVLTYHKANLRMGLVSEFNNLGTSDYVVALVKEGAYSNDIDLRRSIGEYSQRNTSLKAGFEYQFASHSFIHIVDDNNEEYRCSLSAIWSVYFDVFFLINHSANFTEYKYTAIDQDGIETEVSENVFPADFLTERKYGFALGLKSTRIPENTGKANITNQIELGLTPGYYSRMPSAMYVRYSITYGIGGFRNIFKK